MLHNIIIYGLLLTQSIFLNSNTATVTVDNAKIRSCPGLSCKLLGELSINHKLTLLESLHEEEVGKYGTNKWYRFKYQNKDAYIFGGLLNLPSKLNVPQRLSGLIKTDANVRFCPSQDCPVLDVRNKGEYLERLTRHKGKWYKFQLAGSKSNKTYGYIHSSLVSLTFDYLIINFPHKALYDKPNGRIKASFPRGKQLRVRYRNPKSELIRPHGRYYWYKVQSSQVSGWMFGAGTTKEHDPVDCQCVDYVKRKLNIKGATRNAYEWSDVLTGKQPVKINNKLKTLKYKKVSPPRVGDVAVFGNDHPQVDSLYGHIGLVDKIEADSTEIKRILITGANHKEKYIDMRSELDCGNVSEKWYEHNGEVRYFRTINHLPKK